jgi:hypothetical protein
LFMHCCGCSCMCFMQACLSFLAECALCARTPRLFPQFCASNPHVTNHICRMSSCAIPPTLGRIWRRACWPRTPHAHRSYPQPRVHACSNCGITYAEHADTARHCGPAPSGGTQRAHRGTARQCGGACIPAAPWPQGKVKGPCVPLTLTGLGPQGPPQTYECLWWPLCSAANHSGQLRQPYRGSPTQMQAHMSNLE